MASLVILRNDEYMTIASELHNMHMIQLQNISNAIESLKKLATNTEVFLTEYTSEMIVELLDVFSANVFSLLGKAFQDSELGIYYMISKVKSTDSLSDGE